VLASFLSELENLLLLEFKYLCPLFLLFDFVLTLGNLVTSHFIVETIRASWLLLLSVIIFLLAIPFLDLTFTVVYLLASLLIVSASFCYLFQRIMSVHLRILRASVSYSIQHHWI
jgi:hypothetical protein